MAQRAFVSRAGCPCGCQIIPNDVLRKLAEDARLSDRERQQMTVTATVDLEVRKLREQAGELTRVTAAVAPGLPAALAPAPAVKVYDCNHTQTLPGAPVSNPGGSADPSAKAAFDETKAVADFFQQVFGRNSIDGAGMTLLSSVHFGRKYNNAQWNGTQMMYGDGDGSIFVDFTRSNDVIAHELTHGVTQHSLQLVYQDEPGGLNESMSDVFGSMFRQWRANQTVAAADWLIGADILGPKAKQLGYTCLRDMADPAAAHCLASQVKHYSNYRPGMDPHDSSGIPNLAFHLAATAIGGHSWAQAGQIWYNAMTGFGPAPQMSMRDFANRTRQVAGAQFAAQQAAVDQAWRQVGL